jgi:hypothetical protein
MCYLIAEIGLIGEGIYEYTTLSQQSMHKPSIESIKLDQQSNKTPHRSQ